MYAPIVQSAINRAHYMFLPPAQVGICRILHDRECSIIRGPGDFPFLSRFYDPKLHVPRGLPETVRYGGEKGNVTLKPAWVEFFYDINAENPAAISYIKRAQSGWRNYGVWPTVEQLGFGGDYVVVTRIDGNRAYIMSYDNNKTPDQYDIDFIQAFWVVYSDDAIGPPPCGPAYTFVISRGEELWIDKRNLTFLRPV